MVLLFVVIVLFGYGEQSRVEWWRRTRTRTIQKSFYGALFPFIHTHMDEKYGTRGTRGWCVNRERGSRSKVCMGTRRCHSGVGGEEGRETEGV